MTNAALIAKLERAQEGSRGLSDGVLLKCGWQSRGSATGLKWINPDGLVLSLHCRPDPSRNLQDIAELVKARGYQYAIQTFDETEALNPGGAQASVNKEQMRCYQSAEAKTDCTALSAALLKAVEAKDG